MATNLLTVYGLGDDQLTSQFEISWPDGIPGFSGDTTLMTFRMDQSFDMPERQIGTYETFYQGLKAVHTSVVEDTAKEFSLQFRMDQNWQVWQALNGWYKLAFDDFTGIPGSEAQSRVTMLFTALKANKDIAHKIQFDGVKIKTLKPGSWDYTSGDPVRAEAGFIYLIANWDA